MMTSRRACTLSVAHAGVITGFAELQLAFGDYDVSLHISVRVSVVSASVRVDCGDATERTLSAHGAPEHR
jgi:hypothetical protein